MLKLWAPRAPRGAAELSLGSPYRGLLRLLAYVALTLVTIPVQGAALARGGRLKERLPIVYHRWCCRFLGMQVERRGAISSARPTLFVCNHCSYIDIAVLSTQMPVSFVAKSEIADWPFFGLLAKLQRTVFVDRQRRTTHRQRDELAARLDVGDNILLFPEGTSSDGNRLLPFFSALFSVAERRRADGQALVVQPVSLAYTRLDGAPLGYVHRPLVAWYGDMDLIDHLWRLACLGHVTAVVEFHPPVSIDGLGSRKALSGHCERIIRAGLAAALTGRPVAA